MRVISQYGNVDLPYEQLVVYHAMESVMALYNGEKYVLGEYSSKEKSYKAMEMLRGQYKGLEVFKVLASGTAEHMEKSFNSDELKKYIQAYHDINVFQFPQDDEIEV
ncbi:hypothetical protein [Agathobacter sp.]|uniref:hypothetical protein n=1 Tax=Agathobacter sp. TaxID=2021311 RepID=UPI00280BD5A7|nr:hypothetical protein [Agathobacter sp.]